MKRLIKKGLLAVTVFGTLTLGACVSDGYYSSGSTGYSTYPYSRPYVYPSSSVSFYYSSPRYYRHYPRYYRHHGRHYHHRYYHNRPGHHYHNRPHHRPSHGGHHRPHHGGHHRRSR